MDRPGFVIKPIQVQPTAQSLASLVDSTRILARPPISNFRVAAVGLGSSGRIYVGVNLEFPGLPLHHSVHAEQFLVTNLLLNGETSLTSFAVSAAPCGHCRQFLQELRDSENIQILIISDNNDQFTPLSDFLPHRFGPLDLFPEGSPFLLEPRNNGLKLTARTRMNRDDEDENLRSNNGVVCNGHGTVVDDEKLKIAALEAANASHAPLVAFVAGGGGGYDEIVGAVLVEKEGAPVRQEETARLLMRSISATCSFQALLCCSDSNDV
ncbi:cytidine deaminase 1 isoform X2 [Arachis ipaensis]|uniref:cytidine deaminase 1 isoform X2 n=1 Tax=Arachis ipaensis TaxID=130454 RepID=UPI000A2B6723|nr:cytidine deaminase 1 isoform X2 [Arachis ipaensis]